jgi:hypothetical protein
LYRLDAKRPLQLVFRISFAFDILNATLNRKGGIAVEDINNRDQIADRVLRLMPESESELALVITAHLLIEERLATLLATLARDPDFLEKARLQFKQRMLLVRAFSLPSIPAHIWQFVEGLNRLRNKLAHNVEPPDITSEIEQLVKLIPDAQARLPDPVGNVKSRLALTVGVVCGHLFGLRFVHAQLDGLISSGTVTQLKL